MTIKDVDTPKAPKAIGNYSQAVETNANKLLFVSGQLPIDPSTGQLIEGDIKSATRMVLNNIKSILEAGNTHIRNIVRVEIFLADMNDFQAVNEVYAEFFKERPYPARQTIEVARLPKDAQVEISCIAEIS